MEDILEHKSDRERCDECPGKDDPSQLDFAAVRLQTNGSVRHVMPPYEILDANQAENWRGMLAREPALDTTRLRRSLQRIRAAF